MTLLVELLGGVESGREFSACATTNIIITNIETISFITNFAIVLLFINLNFLIECVIDDLIIKVERKCSIYKHINKYTFGYILIP